MGNGLDILSVNDYGQLSVGDSLIIQRAQGDMYFAQVKEVIDKGTKREEIVLSKSKNDYFIMSMFLDDKSWVMECYKIKDVAFTTITNTLKEFPR